MWTGARGRSRPRSVCPHTCRHTCAVLRLGPAARSSPKVLSSRTGVQPGVMHEVSPGPELSTRSNMDCIKALICQISWHLARLVYTPMSLGESFLLLKRLLAFSCRCNIKRARDGVCHFLQVPVDLDQCHWSSVAVVPPTLAGIEYNPVWFSTQNLSPGLHLWLKPCAIPAGTLNALSKDV